MPWCLLVDSTPVFQIYYPPFCIAATYIIMYEESICYDIMECATNLVLFKSCVLLTVFLCVCFYVEIMCSAVGISSCVEDVSDQIACNCHEHRLSLCFFLCFASYESYLMIGCILNEALIPQ